MFLISQSIFYAVHYRMNIININNILYADDTTLIADSEPTQCCCYGKWTEWSVHQLAKIGVYGYIKIIEHSAL